MSNPQNQPIISTLESLKTRLENRRETEESCLWSFPAGSHQRSKQTGILVGLHRAIKLIEEKIQVLNTPNTTTERK